jgi:uncharacterized protein
MFVSLTLADRFAPAELPDDATDELVSRYRDVVRPVGVWVRVITSIIFALFAGIGTNREWNNFDLFHYRVSFTGAAATDPQYHKNIGFYVFQLPFIKFLIGWAFEAVIVVILVTAVAQYLSGGIRFQGSGQRVTPAVKTHISLLLGILAIIQAVNYYFERLELVLSTSHVVDGATATSVHANAPADELLIAIAVIGAVLFLLNIRAKGWTLPVVGVVVWALVWILVGNVYPALYQALHVNPSELTREMPYITRNIDATRTAYGLTNVQTVSNFDSTADATVSSQQISGASPEAVANQNTLANVQLLDPNILVNTFNQLQSLRSFYSINSLSVDRYVLNGVLTETLIGVRELNTSVPPGFTTSHLQYTHGYGAAVAPANEGGVAASGDPAFSLSNAPPAGTPPLNDTGAQVYYGEGSTVNGFVIADSKQEELDYEDAENKQVSTHYTGRGGVPAGNVLRRAIFALSFGNADILLSGQVTAKSRIIYNRNITQRVEKAAPFLKYDANPYSVVVNQQLYWIVDAYTTTANYPYSQDASTSRVSAASGLSGKFNYVSNSVKVVVNAYTGQMWFFVIDHSDPIIQVYEKAFSDLFTNGNLADKIIPGITSHWRYPEDLFEVQTNMYGRYHLTDPTAFFTQANAWNISQDPGSGKLGTGFSITTLNANGTTTTSTKLLDPSYEVAALPGQTQQKFVIVQPFVPLSTSRQNLTAVMFASADPGDYGQLTLYETPPGQTVDGPDLAASIISNTPSISSELTLLNQQSSEVEVGEVVTVPISNTLLYVLPVYVQASSNPIPVLRDVIVVYNGVAYHSENPSLDEALCQITNEPVNGAQPFQQYCNTAAASRPKTPVSQTSGSGTGSTTTTTTPTSSTTQPSATTPPANGTTLTQLLDGAQTAYRRANAALKAGDLAAYQSAIAQAEADVNAAAALESPSTTAKPTTTTATTAKPKTTGSATTTAGG